MLTNIAEIVFICAVHSEHKTNLELEFHLLELDPKDPSWTNICANPQLKK